MHARCNSRANDRSFKGELRIWVVDGRRFQDFGALACSSTSNDSVVRH